MPCWARLSTSLIIFEFAAVSSSSSFTRSRIGWVCFCTYFLRANGLTLPQKPWRLSYCRGALPVAPAVEVDDAACDWSLGVELAGCWASAGNESKNATNNATTARFFIVNILHRERWGPCGLVRLRNLHALRGRDRDLVRPWKTGQTVRLHSGAPFLHGFGRSGTESSISVVPASADATLTQKPRRR